MAFKARIRRDRLLGEWAAAQLGLSDEAAKAYSQQLLDLAIQRHGEERIVAKIVADFAAKGVALDHAHVKAELERCAKEARRQLGIR